MHIPRPTANNGYMSYKFASEGGGVINLAGTEQVSLHRGCLEEVAHVRIEQRVVLLHPWDHRVVPSLLESFRAPLRHPASRARFAVCRSLIDQTRDRT